MDIFSEFERLKQLTETKDGYDKVRAAWSALTLEGCEERISRNSPKLCGFAIDPVTKYCLIDSNSGEHSAMYDEIVSWLQREYELDLDEALHRVVKGWAGYVLDFAFPLIFMGHPRFLIGRSKIEINTELIESLESSILRQGKGLPFTGIDARYRLNSKH